MHISGKTACKFIFSWALSCGDLFYSLCYESYDPRLIRDLDGVLYKTCAKFGQITRSTHLVWASRQQTSSICVNLVFALYVLTITRHRPNFVSFQHHRRIKLVCVSTQPINNRFDLSDQAKSSKTLSFALNERKLPSFEKNTKYLTFCVLIFT